MIPPMIAPLPFFLLIIAPAAAPVPAPITAPFAALLQPFFLVSVVVVVGVVSVVPVPEVPVETVLLPDPVVPVSGFVPALPVPLLAGLDFLVWVLVCLTVDLSLVTFAGLSGAVASSSGFTFTYVLPSFETIVSLTPFSCTSRALSVKAL